MFLKAEEDWEYSDDEDYNYTPIDTIFCKLQHDYKGDKGYLFELMEYVIISHYKNR